MAHNVNFIHDGLAFFGSGIIAGISAKDLPRQMQHQFVKQNMQSKPFEDDRVRRPGEGDHVFLGKIVARYQIRIIQK